MKRSHLTMGRVWAISACLFAFGFPVNVTAGKFAEAAVGGVLAVVCFVLAWRSP
jgi:hypothetical protein